MGNGGCIMRLSRIRIENFRNFQELDVTLGGNVVIVGENRVGKSNLLFALRLIFDPSLPDSGRQLGRSDFWDGLQSIDADSRVRIFVEIEDFEDAPNIIATLTDYRLSDAAELVRLNYELRPRAALDGDPGRDDEYRCE